MFEDRKRSFTRPVCGVSILRHLLRCLLPIGIDYTRFNNNRSDTYDHRYLRIRGYRRQLGTDADEWSGDALPFSSVGPFFTPTHTRLVHLALAVIARGAYVSIEHSY